MLNLCDLVALKTLLSGREATQQPKIAPVTKRYNFSWSK
jgi:hypothetical protein